MYKIIPWSADLDLINFYSLAKTKGFLNNASQSAMVDCFRNEQEWAVWMLYYNDVAVGSVAAHSIDEGYRICARTCAFTDLLPLDTLRTRNQIKTHQHVTAQFFMPTCMEWVGNKGNMYITSHPSNLGTQRLVHNIWGPAMESTGILSNAFEKEYRGHLQTFWQVHPARFYEDLNKYPRWGN